MSHEQDLNRARALLSVKRLGFELDESEADPPAKTIGALAGYQVQAHEPDVQASIYTFEDWPDEDSVLAQLPAYQNTDPNVYVRTAINGTLFFIAMTRLDGALGRRGEFRVDEMLSAFAGDE